MSLITLKTFDNSFEAHLLKTKLESQDIRVFLFDENLVSINPLYNVTLGGIKLKVDESQWNKAEEILTVLSANKLTNEDNQIISCPECKSEDIMYGFKSMGGTKGVFSAILSFLFMVFPIYFKTVHKCNFCGTEFE